MKFMVTTLQEATGYLRTRAPLLDELCVLFLGCTDFLLFFSVLSCVEVPDGV